MDISPKKRVFYRCPLSISIVSPEVEPALRHYHSFIHSGHFKSSTTQRRSRLQQGYCIGVSRRSAQATVGKGLVQGPYVAARTEVELTTLRLKVIDPTNAPP